MQYTDKQCEDMLRAWKDGDHMNSGKLVECADALADALEERIRPVGDGDVAKFLMSFEAMTTSGSFPGYPDHHRAKVFKEKLDKAVGLVRTLLRERDELRVQNRKLDSKNEALFLQKDELKARVKELEGKVASYRGQTMYACDECGKPVCGVRDFPL